MNKYINHSYLIAGFISVGLILWFLSGSKTAIQTTNIDEEKIDRSSQIAEIMSVKVVEQRATPIEEEIILRGHSMPDRQVTVRAETSGKINAVLVARGVRVEQGQPIIKIAMDDRSARLRKAKAKVKQWVADNAAIIELSTKGHVSKMQVNEANTNLEIARAELETIEQEIDKTVLRAPFAGVLNSRDVEVGDYVTINDPVFTVIDDNPLIASADLPQQHIMHIQLGQTGQVQLITQQEAEGTIRYISASANESTRTFPIEIEFANPDGRLMSGVSVDIRIPTTVVSAHHISAASLVRNDIGNMGVYTVDAENRTQYYEVKIVRAAGDGIWVSGLPELSRIVSVGQGFIRDGELVNVIVDKYDPANSGATTVVGSVEKENHI